MLEEADSQRDAEGSPEDEERRRSTTKQKPENRAATVAYITNTSVLLIDISHTHLYWLKGIGQ